jgi:hypothetical protein
MNSTYAAEEMSMTIAREHRFSIFVSMRTCQGAQMKVKTHWHAGLTVQDNLRQILVSNHYCMCPEMTQPRHTMERPILIDAHGYIYNQADLVTENGHFSVKTFAEYQREDTA